MRARDEVADLVPQKVVVPAERHDPHGGPLPGPDQPVRLQPRADDRASRAEGTGPGLQDDPVATRHDPSKSAPEEDFAARLPDLGRDRRGDLGVVHHSRPGNPEGPQTASVRLVLRDPVRSDESRVRRPRLRCRDRRSPRGGEGRPLPWPRSACLSSR